LRRELKGRGRHFGQKFLKYFCPKCGGGTSAGHNALDNVKGVKMLRKGEALTFAKLGVYW
jgi:hypothetical protein